MVFDALSVIPTLATNQKKPFYFFKLIRFLRIGETYKAINSVTKVIIKQFSSLSKGQVEQANNII